nr:YcgJ family protein [Ensifer sp. Root31]
MFCDVKERLCREDRYYGANGQRSGAVSKKYTKVLFGE